MVVHTAPLGPHLDAATVAGVHGAVALHRRPPGGAADSGGLRATWRPQ